MAHSHRRILNFLLNENAFIGISMQMKWRFHNPKPTALSMGQNGGYHSQLRILQTTERHIKFCCPYFPNNFHEIWKSRR